jgi:hypothetical protein
MRRFLIALALVLLATIPAPAFAADRNAASGIPKQASGVEPVTLPTDGMWHYSQCNPEQIGPDGQYGWMDIPTQGELWQVVASERTVLHLTDLYVSGDRYEVYVDGALQLTTSKPFGRGSIEPEVDCACAVPFIDQDLCNRASYSPRYSHGALVLSPGTHLVNIKDISFPALIPAGFAIRAFPTIQVGTDQ